MDRVVDQANTGGHNRSARLTNRKLPRLRLFKTALAVLAGGFGAELAGTLGPPAVEAATTEASSFAAYGTDTTYMGDPETGFDASDVDAGFTTGVSGNGKLAGVVGTVGTLLADDRTDSPPSPSANFAADVLALGANGKLPGGIPYKKGTGVFAYAAHGAVGVDAGCHVFDFAAFYE